MENGVMMQYFEWNLPNDGMLWKGLKDDASHLHEIGISAAASHSADVPCEQGMNGYGTYDLYDLGFSIKKKGNGCTKYGINRNFKK